MKDLYKILGVSESADDDTIKKAYRKLAREYHPDVTGNDKKKTERFKEINEAYGILGEPAKRKEYDRLRHAPVGADGMPQGFDPEAFAQAFGGGRGAPGGFTFTTEFGDISDLFASLFGGQAAGRNPFARSGGRPGRRAAAPGPDLAGEMELTFAEAALGTRKTIRTGSGGTVEVSVPAGVDTGGRLRLAGQGGAAPGGKGNPGDLHLEVVVRADPHLRRSGDDVELDLPVSVAEAILGAKIDVPTVEGTVRVSIPPGTSSGARLRLRGKGIKRPDGARGDQICRVQVVVPKLSPDDADARRLVEELDKRTHARVRDF